MYDNNCQQWKFFQWSLWTRYCSSNLLSKCLLFTVLQQFNQPCHATPHFFSTSTGTWSGSMLWGPSGVSFRWHPAAFHGCQSPRGFPDHANRVLVSLWCGSSYLSLFSVLIVEQGMDQHLYIHVRTVIVIWTNGVLNVYSNLPIHVSEYGEGLNTVAVAWSHWGEIPIIITGAVTYTCNRMTIL